MNRIGLKYAAKDCLADADLSPALVTLVFLLGSLVLSIPDNLSVINTALHVDEATTYDELYSIYEYFSNRAWLISFILGLISTVWEMGYKAYALHLSRGEEAGFGSLLEGFRIFGKIIWLNILIGIFIYLWSLLFIIPGFVAAYRYKMAYYALLDDPTLSAREALAVSKRLTYGHKLELFVLDLSFLGWQILIALTCGILGIWKLPYIYATYAHAFNWLQQLDRQQSDYPPLNEYPPLEEDSSEEDW